MKNDFPGADALSVVLSCEHGGNRIPAEYNPLFEGAEGILKTHRGYDIGAAELFGYLKDAVAYSHCATISRLIVDVNRSLYRRSLFSEFTKGLNQKEKQTILDAFYFSYRDPFKEKIFALLKAGKSVMHLSVHSFTPEYNGTVRQTDFGILYHPGRPKEKRFAKIWKEEIKSVLPGYRTRFNYPYQGKPDGHVRYFRDREAHQYLGIELEMNQKHAGNTELYSKLADSFKAAVERMNGMLANSWNSQAT